MDQGLATVIGMSIAYFVSMLGMLLAAYRWKQNQKEAENLSDDLPTDATQ